MCQFSFHSLIDQQGSPFGDGSYTNNLVSFVVKLCRTYIIDDISF